MKAHLAKKGRFTGERPTFEKGQNFLICESLCRYNFARSYCKDKKVLDIGCGEGFGTAILADYGHEVIGIDYDDGSISYANAAFKKPNLEFIRMDCAKLAFENKTFEMISGFEIIEHLLDPDLFLCEIHRILKDDGIVILSTMQRRGRSPSGNPFHVKEYSSDEFQSALSRYYKTVELFGLFCARKINPLQKFIMKLDSRHILRTLRQRFNFAAISKIERFLGTVPPAEVGEGDFIVKQGDLSRSINIIAVCHNKGI